MKVVVWRRTLSHYLVAAGLLCLAGALPREVHAQDGCANQSATLPAQPAQAPGLGGTGLQAIKPGLGGTGMDDPGIGGTGILGVITGFASVCVNGVEVHFDDSTPINENAQPASINALAVGKVVAIQAQAQGKDYVARRIAILNSVVGLVDAVHPASGALSLLGQTVTVPPGVASSAIQAGQWVQVSGHRRANGQIEASYLSVVAPQGLAQMTGRVERTMGVDLVVSGTEVNLAGAPRPANIQRGDEVTVSGVWDGRTLRAQSLLATGNQQLGKIQELVVEGYVHTLSAQNISLGGASFTFAKGVEVQGGRGGLQDVAVDQLVRMTGRTDDSQQLRINRIEIRRSASGRGPSDTARRSESDDGSKSDDSSRSGSSKSGSSSGSSDSSERSGSSGSSGTSGSSSGSGSGSSGKSGSSGSSGSSGKGK